MSSQASAFSGLQVCTRNRQPATVNLQLFVLLLYAKNFRKRPANAGFAHQKINAICR